MPGTKPGRRWPQTSGSGRAPALKAVVITEVNGILALDNLEAVLAGGQMALANVVRLTVYTTDVDELFRHWGIFRAAPAASAAALRRRCSAWRGSHYLVLLEATAAG